MLALTADELAPTDTTDAAIDAFNGAGIREIVMVGRRGPAQASFTTPELIELGELAGADVIVDPVDLEGAEPTDTNSKRNLEVLREYATRRPEGKPKRLVLRFLLSPVAILGEDPRDGPRKDRPADEVQRLLLGRAARPVVYEGWTSIDGLERAAGERLGRPRVKLCSWDELLAAAERVAAG